MNIFRENLNANGEDRQRLPSLYSDFTLQRQSNPDGFAANINAWQNALAKAGRAGVLPAKGNGSDTLLLSTGQSLLRSLETKEWGVPLALGAVIVRGLYLLWCPGADLIEDIG